MNNVLHQIRRKGVTVSVLGTLNTPAVRVDLPGGLCEWPAQDEDGNLFWDYPERVPHYAKKAAAQAFDWIAEQTERREVLDVLEDLLRGPMPEARYREVVAHLDHASFRMLRHWTETVDGAVRVSERLTRQLVAYINASK